MTKKTNNMKYMNNIKIVFILFITSISILFIVNLFFKIKVENKIEKQFNNYKFSKHSFMEGITTKLKEINCTGFFVYDCSIKDFSLETNIDNRNIVIAETSELELNTISMLKPLYVDLNFKNIEIGKILKESLFLNYDDEEYKKLGSEVYTYIENTNLKINLKIDKLNKIEYQGNIDIDISNKLMDIESKFDIYIKEGLYTETIDVKDENEINSQEELKSDITIPFFAKINSFEYTINNKDMLNCLYLIYKINAKNILEQNKDLISFNNYYLGKETNSILEKNEFLDGFFSMLSSIKERVPSDEITLKKIIENAEQLYSNKIDILKITGKNRNNISIQKSGLFILFDNLNTSKRYLDESFDIKFEKIK